MNRLIFSIVSLSLLFSACKKEEDSNTPSTKNPNFKTIEHEKEFDFGTVDCTNPTITNMNSTHLFVEGCDHIYRYDKDLNLVDWIGFDGNASFGIHDISDQSTLTTGKISLLGINNTHAYIKHQYDGWANDSVIVIEFATGDLSTFESDELNKYNFFVQSDGTIFRYDFDDASSQNVMKKYDEKGNFIENLTITGEFSFGMKMIKLDSEDNFYLLQGIQDPDYAPPLVSKFNSSFSKEMEFVTDLREQYVPHFVLSDEDIIYVADSYIGEWECYAYDRDGNLLNSYNTSGSDQQFFIEFVFNKKALTKGHDQIWRIWSVPE